MRRHRAAEAAKAFREAGSGAKADRAQLRQLLAQSEPGDVLTAARLGWLACSTRHLLNTLSVITERRAGGRVAKLVGKLTAASPVRDVREFRRRDQDGARRVGHGSSPSHRGDGG